MRTTVLVLIDALGAEIARRWAFLDGSPGRGSPLETVAGFSSAALPAILTGRPAREHGHFAMYRRAGPDGVFRPYAPLLRLAARTRGRGRVRKLVKAHLSRTIDGYFELYDVPTDLLPRFDLVQRRDIFRPGAFAPVTTFVDELAASGLPHRIFTWKDDEERSFHAVGEDLRDGSGRFYFLYTAILDALLHREGTASEAIGRKLAWYEREIARIREAAHAGGRVLHLFVMSDHGMSDVHQTHDVHAALDAAGFRVPADGLVFTDSTMARFWFAGADAETRVRRALPDAPWGRWLTPEDLERYGIDVPGAVYGEAIFLLEPGHVIAPSFMGERACAGMHGYGPEDATSRAFFFADPTPDLVPRSILGVHDVMLREIAWLKAET